MKEQKGVKVNLFTDHLKYKTVNKTTYGTPSEILVKLVQTSCRALHAKMKDL